MHGRISTRSVSYTYTRADASSHTRVLNFTRVMDVLYKDADEFTHVGKLMKDLIVWMLIDPVPI